MNTSLRVLISVVFYAVANLILDRKLSNFSLPSLMVMWEPVMLVCGWAFWGYYRYTDQPLVTPEFGWPFVFLVIMAVTYFIADSFYVSAYTSGGSLFTITTVFLAFPPVTGLLKVITDNQYPSRAQVLGYLLIAGGVLMCVWNDKSQAQ